MTGEIVIHGPAVAGQRIYITDDGMVLTRNGLQWPVYDWDSLVNHLAIQDTA